jgi:hypothetical protein
MVTWSPAAPPRIPSIEMSATVRAQPHLGASVVRVDFERAEGPAEGELLLVGQRLFGEDEDAAAISAKTSGTTGRVSSTPRSLAPSMG